MEVDLGLQICKKKKKKREEEERAAKSRVDGKMKIRSGIYRAQNIRRYTAAKGSTQWRSMSM